MLLICIFIYQFSNYRFKLIPGPLQIILELNYKLVLNVIKTQAGPAGIRFLPLFFTLFNYILMFNLLGLLPYAFTATGQLILPITIALSYNLFLFLYGFEIHGPLHMMVYVPKGTPLFVMPLVVIIEIASYILRTFSLAIRLFANLMAGHTLLHILASFIPMMLSTSTPFLAIFPLILVCAVSCLEIGIAFLQAYVFLILCCIYLNNVQHPEH